VRILFVVNRMAHVRHFDRAVRLLADRGHDIVLASQDDDVDPGGAVAGCDRVVTTPAPQRRTDEWADAARLLRRSRDYLRYLHPRYAGARPLRSRAFEEMISAVSSRRSRELDAAWSELLVGMQEWEQQRLDAALAKLHSVVPADPAIHAFVSAQRADMLVVSPMVGVGFSQAEYVKSARELGIPSGVLVYSWDNLSNKGLIHETPDRMWVWNEVQAAEAVALHEYPAERVVVTGAARFDAFFEMRGELPREDLCAQLGLDAARPIVSYLCSSRFVAPHERAFVDGWIRELRRSADPSLAGCSVIVRPHPAGVKEWHAPDRQVIRWPRACGDVKASASRPFDDPHTVVMSSRMQNADQVLYDTVFHSAAVVGLNTSAEIEAAIVGRPVFTLVDPDAEGQLGSLHFRYLLKEEGGHVEIAGSVAEHMSQLANAVAGRNDSAAIESFVRRFVRPHGLGAPVSPILADAIETLAPVSTAVPAGS
jgi:hypothetical protein